MPAVVVLGREPRNVNAAAVELGSQLIRAEELREREAEAFDPVLSRQIHSGEYSEAAVSRAGDDAVVVWFVNGARVGFQLARKELVESGVLGRIGLLNRCIRLRIGGRWRFSVDLP